MKKDDKDKLDALLRLAEIGFDRFDQRRNHSWKIALAFWAAILGSVTLLESRIPLLAPCTQLIGAGLVLVLHTFWLAMVFEADKKDRLFAYGARNRAISLLKTDLKTPPDELSNRRWYGDWGVWFQLLTTLLLLSMIIYVLNVLP